MKSRSHNIRTSPKAARKLREFYDALLARYGPQQWWPAKTALEVVVGAFLTQNTSWKGVERSIALLESHGVLTLEGLRNTSEDELQQMIRPSGYMIRKAAAIKAFIQFLDDHYGGSLLTLAAESTPIARDKLLSLPGVGPETADAILLYALGHPVVVVDEYLRRVTARHRLLPEGAKYQHIQQLSLAAFAEDAPDSLRQHYNEFHALIVQVGKDHCGPAPRCGGCPLSSFHPRPRGVREKDARTVPKTPASSQPRNSKPVS